MSSHLPHDLVAEIVDILAANQDHSSLFCLSETCKAALHLCRRHIFATITLVPRNWDVLTDDPKSGKGYRLRSLSINRTLFRVRIIENLLTSSPDILKYVRTLHVQSHRSNYNDGGYLHVLSQFNNLSFLSIVVSDKIPGQDPYHSKMTWSSFPLSYQAALVNLVQRSPLQSLAFNHIGDIPRGVVRPCKDLVHLAMYCSTFSWEESAGPGPLSDQPISVKELWFRYDIEGASPLLDRDAPIIDPAGLETFGFELQSAHESGREHELVANAANLENLIITDPVNGFPTFLTRFLRHLHPNAYNTLTFLRYKVAYRSVPDSHPMPSTVLQGLQFAALERLEIALDMESTHCEVAILEDFTALDAILAYPEYSTLEIFSLIVSSSYPVADPGRWKEVPRTCLWRLAENPAVDFDYQFF